VSPGREALDDAARGRRDLADVGLQARERQIPTHQVDLAAVAAEPVEVHLQRTGGPPVGVARGIRSDAPARLLQPERRRTVARPQPPGGAAKAAAGSRSDRHRHLAGASWWAILSRCSARTGTLGADDLDTGRDRSQVQIVAPRG
jgi:hypothetical protein